MTGGLEKIAAIPVQGNVWLQNLHIMCTKTLKVTKFERPVAFNRYVINKKCTRLIGRIPLARI